LPSVARKLGQVAMRSLRIVVPVLSVTVTVASG